MIADIPLRLLFRQVISADDQKEKDRYLLAFPFIFFLSFPKPKLRKENGINT